MKRLLKPIVLALVISVILDPVTVGAFMPPAVSRTPAFTNLPAAFFNAQAIPARARQFMRQPETFDHQRLAAAQMRSATAAVHQIPAPSRGQLAFAALALVLAYAYPAAAGSLVVLAMLPPDSPKPDAINVSSTILWVLNQADRRLTISEISSLVNAQARRKITLGGFRPMLMNLHYRNVIQFSQAPGNNPENDTFELRPWVQEHFDQVYALFDEYRNRYANKKVQEELAGDLDILRISLQSAEIANKFSGFTIGGQAGNLIKTLSNEILQKRLARLKDRRERAQEQLVKSDQPLAEEAERILAESVAREDTLRAQIAQLEAEKAALRASPHIERRIAGLREKIAKAEASGLTLLKKGLENKVAALEDREKLDRIQQDLETKQAVLFRHQEEVRRLTQEAAQAQAVYAESLNRVKVIPRSEARLRARMQEAAPAATPPRIDKPAAPPATLPTTNPTADQPSTALDPELERAKADLAAAVQLADSVDTLLGQARSALARGAIVEATLAYGRAHKNLLSILDDVETIYLERSDSVNLQVQAVAKQARQVHEQRIQQSTHLESLTRALARFAEMTPLHVHLDDALNQQLDTLRQTIENNQRATPAQIEEIDRIATRLAEKASEAALRPENQRPKEKLSPPAQGAAAQGVPYAVYLAKNAWVHHDILFPRSAPRELDADVVAHFEKFFEKKAKGKAALNKFTLSPLPHFNVLRIPDPYRRVIFRIFENGMGYAIVIVAAASKANLEGKGPAGYDADLIKDLNRDYSEGKSVDILPKTQRLEGVTLLDRFQAAKSSPGPLAAGNPSPERTNGLGMPSRKSVLPAETQNATPAERRASAFAENVPETHEEPATDAASGHPSVTPVGTVVLNERHPDHAAFVVNPVATLRDLFERRAPKEPLLLRPVSRSEDHDDTLMLLGLIPVEDREERLEGYRAEVVEYLRQAQAHPDYIRTPELDGEQVRIHLGNLDHPFVFHGQTIRSLRFRMTNDLQPSDNFRDFVRAGLAGNTLSLEQRSKGLGALISYIERDTVRIVPGPLPIEFRLRDAASREQIIAEAGDPARQEEWTRWLATEAEESDRSKVDHTQPNGTAPEARARKKSSPPSGVSDEDQRMELFAQAMNRELEWIETHWVTKALREDPVVSKEVQAVSASPELLHRFSALQHLNHLKEARRLSYVANNPALPYPRILNEQRKLSLTVKQLLKKGAYREGNARRYLDLESLMTSAGSFVYRLNKMLRARLPREWVPVAEGDANASRNMIKEIYAEGFHLHLSERTLLFIGLYLVLLDTSLSRLTSDALELELWRPEEIDAIFEDLPINPRGPMPAPGYGRAPDRDETAVPAEEFVRLIQPIRDELARGHQVYQHSPPAVAGSLGRYYEDLVSSADQLIESAAPSQARDYELRRFLDATFSIIALNVKFLWLNDYPDDLNLPPGDVLAINRAEKAIDERFGWQLDRKRSGTSGKASQENAPTDDTPGAADFLVTRSFPYVFRHYPLLAAAVIGLAASMNIQSPGIWQVFWGGAVAIALFLPEIKNFLHRRFRPRPVQSFFRQSA